MKRSEIRRLKRKANSRRLDWYCLIIVVCILLSYSFYPVLYLQTIYPAKLFFVISNQHVV